MRLLPSVLITALLVAVGSPLGLGQHSSANRYSTHSSLGKRTSTKRRSLDFHPKGGSDIPMGPPKHGLGEELTKIEHQPLSQGSVAASRQKAGPKVAPLPKLDSEKKGKSGGIRIASSSHRKQGLTANTASRRTSPGLNSRMH